MRCKVGDLAFIVKPELESNLGALVEVLRPGGPAKWHVRSLCGIRPASDGTMRMEAVALDVALRPLRGDARPKRRKYAARRVAKALAEA